MASAFKTIKVQEVKPVETVGAPEGHHLPELGKQFLFAGKALFTISNATKGEHYTYKIRVREYDSRDGRGKVNMAFLQVKREGGKFPYRYVGVVDPLSGAVKTTKQSEFKQGSKEFDVAQWGLAVVFSGKMIPKDYHIEHAGRCGRCAKTLTDPDSIKRGIGPECAELISRLS